MFIHCETGWKLINLSIISSPCSQENGRICCSSTSCYLNAACRPAAVGPLSVCLSSLIMSFHLPQILVYEGEMERAQGQLEVEMQNLEEEKNRVIEEAFIRAESEMKAVHENLAGQTLFPVICPMSLCVCLCGLSWVFALLFQECVWTCSACSRHSELSPVITTVWRGRCRTSPSCWTKRSQRPNRRWVSTLRRQQLDGTASTSTVSWSDWRVNCCGNGWTVLLIILHDYAA